MPHTRLSKDEVAQRGNDLYEHQIRDIVETDENIGKQIVIDVETGDYEIDHDGLAASRRLRTRHADPALYGLRIGYDAVYTIGGTLTRTTRR